MVSDFVSRSSEPTLRKNCNQFAKFEWAVICEINGMIEEQLEQLELLEMMNITPTESEAWDIVQMEEVERELLGDFDEETN